ncbi:hypothetical protein ANTPLA_LOCUS7988 [Anthophora plagiata]
MFPTQVYSAPLHPVIRGTEPKILILLIIYNNFYINVKQNFYKKQFRDRLTPATTGSNSVLVFLLLTRVHTYPYGHARVHSVSCNPRNDLYSELVKEIT